MSQITTIHKAICFIEANLRQSISVGQIADAVGYSLFHFSRTFNRIVHHTPYDYLMRRRLAESAEDLLTTGQRIIDIAYTYQFANPETYTRAFRRMFLLTPSQARTQGYLPFRSKFPQLTRAHLEHRAGDPRPHVDIITFPRTCITGLMTVTNADKPETLDELWGILEVHMTQTPRDIVYAVTQQPTPGGNHCAIAMAGWASSGRDALWGMVTTTVPPAKAARCAVRKTLDEIPIILDYMYHTWMPKAKVRPAQPLEIIVHRTARDHPLPGTPEAVLIPIILLPHAPLKTREV